MTAKRVHRRPPRQGCTSALTIRCGTFPYLLPLLLSPPPPPSALAPSMLPGSCSSHCCHQPGQDEALGHSGLPGIKANMMLSYQAGKSIICGLSKTQKQQGRTPIWSPSLAPILAWGRVRRVAVFFLPRDPQLQSSSHFSWQRNEYYCADKPN